MDFRNSVQQIASESEKIVINFNNLKVLEINYDIAHAVETKELHLPIIQCTQILWNTYSILIASRGRTSTALHAFESDENVRIHLFLNFKDTHIPRVREVKQTEKGRKKQQRE